MEIYQNKLFEDAWNSKFLFSISRDSSRDTYQLNGHIFVSIEIFSQPQFSKVSAANFFTHAEVWTNHKNSRIAPCTPAPMSSPACCLRHLFPFLCLSLAPSLVKIHKLVIPWPLHGYFPAMQTIETPMTMETVLGRGREKSHRTEERCCC